MSSPSTACVRRKINYEMFNDPAYQHHVKTSLAAELAVSLLDKIEFRQYNDPYTKDVMIEARLIALSAQEFAGNYGNQMQRRGISNGTMAVMENGNWKILGNSSVPQPQPKPKPVTKTAVDYLTSKVNELRT